MEFCFQLLHFFLVIKIIKVVSEKIVSFSTVNICLLVYSSNDTVLASNHDTFLCDSLLVICEVAVRQLNRIMGKIYGQRTQLCMKAYRIHGS